MLSKRAFLSSFPSAKSREAKMETPWAAFSVNVREMIMYVNHEFGFMAPCYHLKAA